MVVSKILLGLRCYCITMVQATESRQGLNFASSPQVLAELERKATSTDGTVDRVKLRKMFYALSKTARVIFGPQYVRTKKKMDTESRAAVRKTD